MNRGNPSWEDRVNSVAVDIVKDLVLDRQSITSLLLKQRLRDYFASATDLPNITQDDASKFLRMWASGEGIKQDKYQPIFGQSFILYCPVEAMPKEEAQSIPTKSYDAKEMREGIAEGERRGFGDSFNKVHDDDGDLPPSEKAEENLNLEEAVSAMERRLIYTALTKTSNNQTEAAGLLGISRDALKRRIAKYGIRTML